MSNPTAALAHTAKTFVHITPVDSAPLFSIMCTCGETTGYRTSRPEALRAQFEHEHEEAAKARRIVANMRYGAESYGTQRVLAFAA